MTADPHFELCANTILPKFSVEFDYSSVPTKDLVRLHEVTNLVSEVVNGIICQPRFEDTPAGKYLDAFIEFFDIENSRVMETLQNSAPEKHDDRVLRALKLIEYAACVEDSLFEIEELVRRSLAETERRRPLVNKAPVSNQCIEDLVHLKPATHDQQWEAASVLARVFSGFNRGQKHLALHLMHHQMGIDWVEIPDAEGATDQIS